MVPRDDSSSMEHFSQYICNLAIDRPELVRAFAIRKCGARRNDHYYIELIVQYFTPMIRMLTEEESQRTEAHFAAPEFMYIPPETHDLTDTNNYLYAAMFLEMIRTIHRNTETNLVKKFHIEMNISIDVKSENDKCECNICYEEYEKKNFIRLNCGHEFCKDCIKQSLQNERRIIPCCAFCRTNIKNIELRLESIKDELKDLIGN